MKLCRLPLKNKIEIIGQRILLVVSLIGGLSAFAHAGPLQILAGGDLTDSGLRGDDPRHALCAEPHLILDSPSHLPYAEESQFEVRGVYENAVRSWKGNDVDKVNSFSAGLTLFRADPKGWSYGLRAILQPSEVLLRDGNDSYAINESFKQFKLSAGRRLGEKSTFGLSLQNQWVQGPLQVPAFDIGDVNPIQTLGLSYSETRLRGEIEKDFSDGFTVRGQIGYGMGKFSVESLNLPQIISLPSKMDGLDGGIEARYKIGAGRVWSIEGHNSNFSGNGTAFFQQSSGPFFPVGTTSAHFNSSQWGLFWRREQKLKAKAIGIERTTLSSNAQTSLSLAPFKPGDILYASAIGTAQAQVKTETFALKMGSLRRFSNGFFYNTGLQIGNAKANGLAGYRANLLFAGVQKTETFDENRWFVTPILGLGYNRGHSKIQFQLTQFIPLPENKPANPNPFPPPPVKRKANGGTTASISWIQNF